MLFVGLPPQVTETVHAVVLTGSLTLLQNVNSAVGTHAGSIVQELCESRGGRLGLSVLTSLLVSVDVKLY